MRRGGAATIFMIALTVLAVVALPLCLLLLAGMIPAMVSVLLDRYRARYLTRTVGAMNLAGIAPLALQLWNGGFTLAGAISLLSNPLNWLMMYGAAALGWGLFFVTPPLARIIVDLRADQAQSDLKARAEQLIAEWGEEVAGRGRAGRVTPPTTLSAAAAARLPPV